MFKMKIPLQDGGVLEITKVFEVNTAGQVDVANEICIKLTSRNILIGFVANLNDGSAVDFVEGIIANEEEKISLMAEQEFVGYLPELLAEAAEKILHYDVIKVAQTIRLVGQETLDTKVSVVYNEFLNLMETLGVL